MKFTMAVIAVVATVAAASPFAAQNATQDDMPKCAFECLSKIVKDSTECSIDDYNCMCHKKNQAEVMKHAPKCILRACTTGDALKAKDVATKRCKDVQKTANDIAKKNATIAQNTTVHARAFLVRNTTVHGMAAIAQNSTTNKTFVSA